MTKKDAIKAHSIVEEIMCLEKNLETIKDCIEKVCSDYVCDVDFRIEIKEGENGKENILDEDGSLKQEYGGQPQFTGFSSFLTGATYSHYENLEDKGINIWDIVGDDYIIVLPEILSSIYGVKQRRSEFLKKELRKLGNQ